MSRRGSAAVVAAVFLLGTGVPVAHAALPHEASPAPSGAGEPDPELVAEAAEHLAQDRERIEGVEITPEMRAAAVLDLRAEDATFDLRPDDSTTSLETARTEEEDTVVTLTSDLLFEFGSADLTPAARDAVTALADDIPEGAAIEVDGHTDSVGSEELNLDLSQRRADAVADVLRAARADLELTVTGHGESQPVAENEVGGEDNPAGRALNRRVEVTYPTS